MFRQRLGALRLTHHGSTVAVGSLATGVPEAHGPRPTAHSSSGKESSWQWLFLLRQSYDYKPDRSVRSSTVKETGITTEI